MDKSQPVSTESPAPALVEHDAAAPLLAAAVAATLGDGSRRQRRLHARPRRCCPTTSPSWPAPPRLVYADYPMPGLVRRTTHMARCMSARTATIATSVAASATTTPRTRTLLLLHRRHEHLGVLGGRPDAGRLVGLAVSTRRTGSLPRWRALGRIRPRWLAPDRAGPRHGRTESTTGAIRSLGRPVSAESTVTGARSRGQRAVRGRTLGLPPGPRRTSLERGAEGSRMSARSRPDCRLTRSRER